MDNHRKVIILVKHIRNIQFNHNFHNFSNIKDITISLEFHMYCIDKMEQAPFMDLNKLDNHYTNTFHIDKDILILLKMYYNNNILHMHNNQISTTSTLSMYIINNLTNKVDKMAFHISHMLNINSLEVIL